MNIPNFVYEPVIQRGGYFSEIWSLLMQALISELQTNVGTEGFVIPQITSNPANNQVAVLEASFGQQNGAVLGTIIFDPYEVNGAILPARNGQLKVLLNDGTFHNIVNT